MSLVKFTSEEAKKLAGQSDIERFNALTDEEIEEAAKSDPDSALPTPEQLKEFKRRPAHADKKN
jgi:hypothetical protein